MADNLKQSVRARPTMQATPLSTHQHQTPPQEQLNEILKNHEKWVESDDYKKWKNLDDHEKENKIHYRQGRANLKNYNLEKADLEGSNLAGANLRGVNLQRANLILTDLQEAELGGANLQWARLCEANLQKASLNNAILKKADLQDADLRGVTGFLASQLAGANVSGAKLPPSIGKFDGLAYIEEISKKAEIVFTWMLLGCGYAWLTIGTISDARLLVKSASSPLPIMGIDFPIVGLYFAAPLVLLCLYVWFHLYLQNLWNGLSELPAIFPDGKPLDEKVYPWLLIGFVQSHVELLKNHRPPLSHARVGLSIFLTLWLVPITLLFLWGRFLTRHDFPITALHIVLFGLTAFIGITFYELAKNTLRGDDFSLSPWIPFVKKVISYHWGVPIIIGVMILVSVAAIFSTQPGTKDLVSILGFSPFADLAEQEISKKPPNWTGKESTIQEEIFQVKGAKLKGANLRFADMEGAFLIKADLREARLEKARLYNAKLQGANLERAKLQWANLVSAQLQEANLNGAMLKRANLVDAKMQKVQLEYAWLEEADLSNAELQGATLEGARLMHANLLNAKLQGARLVKAKLQGARLVNAKLQGANLQGANLDGADLQGAQLRKVQNLPVSQIINTKNYILAELSPDHIQNLGIQLDHNEKIQNRDLSNYNLNGLDLRKAHLKGFNFEGATLENTRLEEADLRGSGLTQSQLNKACVNDKTILPEGLEKPRDQCPNQKTIAESNKEQH